MSSRGKPPGVPKSADATGADGQIGEDTIDSRLLRWLEEAKRTPVDYRGADRTEAQSYEAKMGRHLHRLRGKAREGTLPQELGKQLDKALPGWRDGSRYNTARALKEAQDLVTWCRQHHSNKLVKRRLDKTLCDDPSQHQNFLRILKFMKRSASGETADEYPEAFAVLDEAFGAKAWRVAEGNSTSVSAPSAAVLSVQSDGQSRRRTRGTATVETPSRASSVNGQVGQGPESLDGGEAQTQPKRLRRATSGSTSQVGANVQVKETRAQRDTSLEAQEISGFIDLSLEDEAVEMEGQDEQGEVRMDDGGSDASGSEEEGGEAATRLGLDLWQARSPVRPICRKTHDGSDNEDFKVDVLGKDCEGPYLLTVNAEHKKGMQGARHTVQYVHWVQRSFNQRQSLGTLKVDGLPNSCLDSVYVALSFLRAHAGWIDDAFGLKIDPRIRHTGDGLFHFSDCLSTPMHGPSYGAATAVALASRFTGRHMKAVLYVIGSTSISGKFFGASGYEEKMLTLGQYKRTDDKAIPHVILPTQGMQDGVLTDRLDNDNTTFEVDLPVLLQDKIRILGAENMFDCLELCLLGKLSGVPRPTGRIPGLAHTYALDGGAEELVECFMYPGDGQVIITGGSEVIRRCIHSGLNCVKANWEQTAHQYHRTHDEPPPMNPFATNYDLHVNAAHGFTIPSISLAVAAAWTSLLLRKPLPKHTGWIPKVGIKGDLSETPLTAGLLDTASRFGLRQLMTSSKHKEEDLLLIEAFNRGVRKDRAIKAVPLDSFSVLVDKLLWNEEDLPLIPPCKPWDEAVLDLVPVPKRKDLYRDELDPAMTV